MPRTSWGRHAVAVVVLAVAGWWAASAPEWVRGVATGGIALWELREAAREALDL